MNTGRNGRESHLRNFIPLQHRRGQTSSFISSTNGDGISKDSAHDVNLDLFSRNRQSLSVTSSDESSDVSVKLGRLSIGSAKLPRSGIDDLLSSTDGGKHDYDWLLTPPGTPVFPSSEGDSHPITQTSRSRSSVRSTATKSSRLSNSQSQSNNHSRPARSSSLTRPSISTSQYITYSSSRSSSILNTSSASVSSYTRPSSPISHSPSTARPSTPSSHSTPSRSSTPSRARPVTTNSSMDKARPSQTSRPSTPSSRPKIPPILHSQTAPSTRTLSRPSTPTRRTSLPSPSSPAAVSSISAGRVLSNGRNSAPTSRPSSPGPRVRPPPQPVVPPDFPLETPPNLRTTLPERPISAGRSRPGSSVSMKGNSETQAPINMPRRHSSPIVTRGRLTDPPARSRVHTNGHHADVTEPQKVHNTLEPVMRRPVKATTITTDGLGFGRTISKKSMDVAIRHMDIRSSSGNIRSLSNTALFPQSIRMSTSKSQSTRTSSTAASTDMNRNTQTSNNGYIVDHGNGINGTEGDEGRYSAKLSEVDIYESSRYDAILLKEDLKNTNWLHSADDKSDQGPIFDNGFEPLPEPFGLV